VAKIIELLQKLGFGEYEAKAYIALLQRSPLNGYELAKASGIPRPNIYALLPRLEERGAVMRLDTPTGPRYAPVPPSELTQRLEDRFQHELAEARRALDEVGAPVEPDYVWNTHGYTALIEQAQTLVDNTKGELLIALWPQEAQALAGNLRAAEQRGAHITTLCLRACNQECGGCRGNIFRYRMAPENHTRWLVTVADGSEMLAGQISSPEEVLSVRTHQHLLVELAAWYVRHSIALATVVADLGDKLPQLLNPQTLEVLSTIGPIGSGGWLEYMEQVLNSSGTDQLPQGKYTPME
jgi:HTH-type transcriptional regulator, sugar sensing transcriptional regulator